MTDVVLEQLVGVLADTLAPRLADELAPRIADELERRASPFLTVDQAAEYLRCDRQRVYDLLSSGRLTRHKDGARVLVSRAELAAYLAVPTPRGGHGAGSTANHRPR